MGGGIALTARASFTITNPTGLHARPAALFVEAAKQHQSTITVANGQKKGNAKSITGLLLLGISQGTTITVEADGPDEEAAVAALRAVLQGLTN